MWLRKRGRMLFPARAVSVRPDSHSYPVIRVSVLGLTVMKSPFGP